MSNFLKAMVAGAVFLSPLVAFARDPSFQTIGDVVATATDVVNTFIPWALILLLFIWAMWQVISNAGDAEKLKKARIKIVWGVVILFALFSLGGIIAVLENTFFNENAGGGGGGGGLTADDLLGGP